ncbi:hypothetical protein ACWCOP_04490 [Maricaulaceae bacterium MS644]
MADAFTLFVPQVDLAENTVRFSFDCPRFGTFAETVAFPDSARLAAIDPAMRDGLLALAAILIGTSYYKAAPAGLVRCEFPLTGEAKSLADLTYGPGLGEFYVRNALAYPPALTIEGPDAGAPAPAPRKAAPAHAPRAVTAFGGGKDSHVASAIIDAAGGAAERVSVILSDKVGDRLQAMSETPVTLIRRTIDPRLIALSKSGEALNGHIPITGINSILLGVYAAARGLDWVVFANEKAASEPTMEANGHPVNHQFSKSLAFEDALRAAFTAAGAGFEYFSVLRPVTEIWTAHYLATRAEFALEIFASCNRNFVFAGDAALAPGRRWCGECAKCVYTAVLLAPFLPVSRHGEIFQSQPLHDAGNLQFLREIAGLTGAKPWECVGEMREVAAALAHLGAAPGWRDAPLIQAVQGELHGHWDRQELADTWAQSLDARSEHRMPDAVAKVVAL